MSGQVTIPTWLFFVLLLVTSESIVAVMLMIGHRIRRRILAATERDWLAPPEMTPRRRAALDRAKDAARARRIAPLLQGEQPRTQNSEGAK